ncbi:MAG: hypothetical protein ACYDH5_16000 [Acidimicrobiales bacterium]
MSDAHPGIAEIDEALEAGLRRVRWEDVGRLGLAWAVTLPAAVCLGSLYGWVLATLAGWP